MSKISTGAMIGILAGFLGCERADLVLTASETVNVYSTLDDATDGGLDSRLVALVESREGKPYR